MKPDNVTNADEPNNPQPVAGDVIGDTAYSERFVLKILIKLANLDTLKDEINDKNFEEDLCLLWDMTAERDVVLFLQKHDTLNLINFALPVIESPRIIEIIIGIIGNMCCQKEVVSAVLKMEEFLLQVLEYSKTDDSLALIQLLRMVNSCLFLSEDSDIAIWISLFDTAGFSPALYFILKNSSNKDLLINALENFNTICSYCNTERHSSEFFRHFIRSEALKSLASAFTEVTVNQKDLCEREELERILVISLQITLNLIGFDTSAEIYKDSKEDVMLMVSSVLDYYEEKLVEQKEIENDLIDVLESTITIVNVLKLNEVSEVDKYFDKSYKMWKTVNLILKSDKNGSANFEQDDVVQLTEFSAKVKTPLCTLMCTYLAHCCEENLIYTLDIINEDYDEIVGSVKNEEILNEVKKRTEKHRTRLKDNVDSQ